MSVVTIPAKTLHICDSLHCGTKVKVQAENAQLPDGWLSLTLELRTGGAGGGLKHRIYCPLCAEKVFDSVGPKRVE